MTDREDFEDAITIDRYLDAIPQTDTAYRARLRTELHTVPPTRRRGLEFRQFWPWGAAASTAVALVAALALLLVPFGPRREAPLDPRTVLAHAVSASTSLTPYTGASETSYVSAPDGAPDSTARDIGTHRVISTWSVRDSTHWRVDIQVLQPALLREHEVAVADGHSVVWYRGLTRHAVRYPLAPRRMAGTLGSILLSTFQGAHGIPPLAQTLQQYLHELNSTRVHTHARLVGQAMVLGRLTDVVEIWPVVRTSSSTGSCSNAKQCAKRSTETDYGRARIWIDHSHGIVLRYREYGLPAGRQLAQSFVYRVTSVTFGTGATAVELAYRSPVPPVSSGPGGGMSGSSGTSGQNQSWRVPPGFITAGPPTDAHGRQYTLAGSGQSQDSSQAVSSIYGVYLRNAPLATGPPTPSSSPSGLFLYVEEQRRPSGLPAQLTSGAGHAAGHCTAYTGTYPDGLHWLALAQDKISLLAVSDHLGEQVLLHWAATRTCL